MPPPLAPSCGHCNREPAESDPPLKICGRCKKAWYCSPDCQRLAWSSHKTSCQLAGLAPLAKAATTLTPAKCGACKKTANLVCDGCKNMTYCSSKCQEKDKPVHDILCSSFQHFQKRPGPEFYRGIYFPEQGGVPYFVWLEAEGSPWYQNLAQSTTDRLLGDGYWRTLDFDDDKRFARTFAHQLSIYHRADFLLDGSGINACLAQFVGPQLAHHWRGPFFATSRKYKDMELDYGVVEPEDQDSDPEDQDSDPEFEEVPLMIMDLDTTSLSPVIAHLQYAARAAEMMQYDG